MRTRHIVSVLLLFLVASNVVLVYKTYIQRQELKNVYQQSDYLKRKQSKLIFDSYGYNFGNLKLNKEYRSSFSFTNTSTKKMRLKNVLTSCGCTAPIWDTRDIQPGEKGTIELSYHAGPVGEFTKYVAVMVHGETKPIQLEIKGNVLAR